MLAQTRNIVGALAIGVATVVSPLAVSPVMGAPDTQQQEGLVNVALVDVVSGNNIGVLANVPIGVAANVCGVSAAVLLAAAGGNDPACTARVTQEQANQLQQDNRTSNPNRGGQEPRQEGLVNVALVDVVSGNNIGVLANVPVGVAANVCGVSVAAILAAAGGNDPACTARVTQEQANELLQENRNRGGQNR